jgi:putative glycosyltransferase (TIGR04372 family)
MRRLGKRIIRGAVFRLKRIIYGAVFRLRWFIIPVVDAVLPHLPARVLLNLVVLAQTLHLPGQYTLLAHLISSISNQQQRDPDSPSAKRMLDASSDVMDAADRHQNTVNAVLELKSFARTNALTVLIARALFELGEFEQARTILTSVGDKEAFDLDSSFAHFRGLLELCADNESEAGPALRTAAIDMPHLMAPHQNLAARDPSHYRPTQLDVGAGPDGRLFDAYNFLGQRVTHVGMGQLSTRLYAKAFEAQKRLQKSAPPVSPECLSYLAELGVSLSNVRIFASEWTTQIGHEGMLDIELRMRDLGWWEGEPIVLVKSGKVANLEFLSLFEDRVKLLSVESSVPHSIARELFSLQRYCGLSFNAFEMPDGAVVQWSEAAALAIHQWDEEGRPPPLRVVFDRKFQSSETLATILDRARRSWGMMPDDWYVCLHLRDGAFYGEAKGVGQSHRNSKFENYRAAIEYITSQGGWVIKLGAKDSLELPPMPRVIDYARSPYKSNLMDLSLIRSARMFIGTTSGLTNVAISFGVPAALVNCISTDAQLWHGQVRFIPKQIVLQNGSAIAHTELTRSPWRWRAFDAGVLARHGATPVDNTPDEILETVKEVMALWTNTADAYAASVEGASDLRSRWQENLSMPHFYGGARISLYYLKKHEKSLFSDAPEFSKTIVQR